MYIPPNIIAINEDLIQELARAPIDLETSFHDNGFGGVIKFVHRFRELVDLVVGSRSGMRYLAELESLKSSHIFNSSEFTTLVFFYWKQKYLPLILVWLFFDIEYQLTVSG